MIFERKPEKWSLDFTDKRTPRDRWIELVAYELFTLRFAKFLADKTIQIKEGYTADMLVPMPTITDAIQKAQEGLQFYRNAYQGIDTIMDYIHRKKPHLNEVLCEAVMLVADEKFKARMERYKEVEG